jgi:hypothetical protein
MGIEALSKFPSLPIRANGFFKYDTPRTGVFNIDHLETKNPEMTIIAETDDLYVKWFLVDSDPLPFGVTGKEEEYILPMGIHKSRLIKWKSGQLSLF